MNELNAQGSVKCPLRMATQSWGGFPLNVQVYFSNKRRGPIKHPAQTGTQKPLCINRCPGIVIGHLR